MNVTEHFEPRTHVTIEDFLTEEEQEKMWGEIKENEEEFETGTVKKDGITVVNDKLKRNSGFIVNRVYPERDDSNIRSMIYYKILKNIDIKFEDMKNPIYLLLTQGKIDDLTKVSAYGEGNYYDWHMDTLEKGLLTVVYTLCRKPKKFKGGNFQLKWDGITKTIPFKNNTVIIFARNTLHRVSEINMESDDFYDRRFSIQSFIQTLF